MDKTQKIALASVVAILAIATLVISTRPKQTAQVTKSLQQTVAESAQVAQTDPATIHPANQLQPLPADDKQAIDSELDNIDKELKTTDNAINSTDLSNASLGL